MFALPFFDTLLFFEHFAGRIFGGLLKKHYISRIESRIPCGVESSAACQAYDVTAVYLNQTKGASI